MLRCRFAAWMLLTGASSVVLLTTGCGKSEMQPTAMPQRAADTSEAIDYYAADDASVMPMSAMSGEFAPTPFAE